MPCNTRWRYFRWCVLVERMRPSFGVNSSSSLIRSALEISPSIERADHKNAKWRYRLEQIQHARNFADSNHRDFDSRFSDVQTKAWRNLSANASLSCDAPLMFLLRGKFRGSPGNFIGDWNLTAKPAAR